MNLLFNTAFSQTTVAQTSQQQGTQPAPIPPDSRKFIPFDTKSVEDEYEQLKRIAESRNSITPAMENNPKKSTNSYFNDYAFISYGGSYLNGDNQEVVKNKFYGLDGTSFPADGLLADYEQSKQPTTENIINWSRSLFANARKKNPNINVNGVKVASNQTMANTGLGSADEAIRAGNEALLAVGDIDKSRTADSASIGNLRYDWKDFSFCKHYGKIPNNRLITLRRFKLPVLDSGAIISKAKMMEAFGRDEEYLTSDSVRALTYFGDDTGNSLNDIISFDVGLNWGELNATTGNPGINQGIDNLGGGNNNLFQAYDFKGQELADMLGVKGGGIIGQDTPFAKIFNTLAMSIRGQKLNQESQDTANAKTKMGQYSGEELKNNRDLALQMANADLYSHGWANRVFGPINVISKTHKRERGLNFANNGINITFKYNLMQVDTINPKLAMIDIVSNLLALTYANAIFYGGDYRFHRQPTEIPLPEDFIDLMQKLASGQGDNMATADFMKSIQGSISDVVKMGEQIFKVGEEEIEKMKKVAPELAKIMSDAMTKVNDVTSNVSTTGDKTGFQNNILQVMGKLKEADTLAQMTTAIDGVYGNKRSPLKSAFSAFAFSAGYNLSNILNNLFSLAPLVTGEPVGEWHLTVGNPMNPIAMIGNLICTGCSISFGETLGADDFPTEIIAKVTLKHGRDRDKGDIESIINQGQGRFYVKVSPTNSDEPWNTGASSKNTENDTAKPLESQLERLKGERNERNEMRNLELENRNKAKNAVADTINPIKSFGIGKIPEKSPFDRG